MFKQLGTKILIWAARLVLARHHPIVIAMTGSIGKTSTRQAIALILASRFNVRTAEKNYNTEVSVPLTILNLRPASTTVGWIRVMGQAVSRAIFSQRSYPTHLVLEFGADRPGDIGLLVSLARPRIGVMTGISHVHVENYPSFEALIAEKAKIIEQLPADGWAVLQGDDEIVVGLRERSNAPVITYGFGPEAEVDGEGYSLRTREDFSFETSEEFCSVSFTARYRKNGESAEVVLPNAIGMPQAYAALAGLAVGICCGVSLAEGVQALKHFRSPKGRLTPLPGIKGSLIIDDSYNAAPVSMKAALDVLSLFHPVETARRIAVLGEMAELGRFTEEMHRQIGWKAAEVGIDLLICVGEAARDIGRGACEAGLEPNSVIELASADEAGRFMDKEIKKGDIVLVKGSQRARMEKVIKDIMAEPERANEFLVRQEAEWLEK